MYQGNTGTYRSSGFSGGRSRGNSSGQSRSSSNGGGRSSSYGGGSSSSSSGGGSSYGRNSGGNRRSYSSGGGHFGGRRSGGRGGRFQSKGLSYDKYISKATPVAEAVKYVPQHKFSEFDLEPILKANIIRKKYENPTPIQDMTVPHILAGRDVIGLASTGSGKTAAFLIPMINKTLKSINEKVLIICPTRELATQIEDELRQFAAGTRVRAAVVIGGMSMGNQFRMLRTNPQFVIATPGRLMDMYERQAINLLSFNNVILDEVDRMLDMGFLQDIKFLISKLKTEKQTLFFSATLDRASETIANTLLKNPVKVELQKTEGAKSIEQDIVKVGGANKVDVLHDILIKPETVKTLIFTKTKRGSDKLTYELKDRGFKVDSIHGDKTQFKRDMVISKFKTNAITVLVATDVAARGLDIPDITHVINYDEPATYEDYVHRIGRTGRIGKKGTGLTFVS